MVRKNLAIVIILSLLILPAVTLLPASRVNAANVNVPGDYATIQLAIDNANPGDTIIVAAGTYTEDLSIPNTKTNLEIKPASGASVTIKGVATLAWANFPLPAPNIDTQANDVKIHGFTIESPDVPTTDYSSGMVLTGTNVEIYNNSFVSKGTGGGGCVVIQTYRDNVLGYDSDISGLNIHDNDFSGTPGGQYVGVFINHTTVGAGTVSIQNNAFTGNIYQGAVTERSDTVISMNEITTSQDTGAGGTGVIVRDWDARNQNNVQITGNIVKGVTAADGFAYGLRIGAPGQTLTNISIQYNAMQTNNKGIQIRSSANGVVVNYNDISGNTTLGVENTDVAVLNATDNWWGADSGPGGGVADPVTGRIANGSGDAISTNVHFDPWLISSGSTGSATGTGTVEFDTTDGGITGLTAVNETTLPVNGKPLGLTFPYGLFSFNIVGISPGSCVTVSITLPSSTPKGTQYWKYQEGKGWCQIPLGDNDGDNIITIQLCDGGVGDADGLANGIIIDPGGPTIPASAPTSQQVSPSLPRQLIPAQISVQYLSVSPQQTTANQPVTVTTNVVNNGDEAGNLNVALKINGQVEQTKMVSVGARGTQPVKFAVSKSQPGTYTVDINDQQAKFTVLGTGGQSSETPVSDGLIAVLAIAVLVIITAVILVLGFHRSW